MWLLLLTLSAAQEGGVEQPEAPVLQDPGGDQLRGYADGQAAARETVRASLPALLGVGAGGAAAGAGVAIGALPRLETPVCAGLACGAVGVVSAAWAWDLANATPPPGPWQSESDAYQRAYLAGYEEGSLRLRRKWTVLAGAGASAAVGLVTLGVVLAADTQDAP